MQKLLRRKGSEGKHTFTVFSIVLSASWSANPANPPSDFAQLDHLA